MGTNMGSIMGVALLALVPFGLGCSRLPSWALGVVPVALLGLGLWSSATEPPNYDMPGLGLYFYAGLGLMWLVISVGGRGVRLANRRAGPERHE